MSEHIAIDLHEHYRHGTLSGGLISSCTAGPSFKGTVFVSGGAVFLSALLGLPFGGGDWNRHAGLSTLDGSLSDWWYSQAQYFHVKVWQRIVDFMMAGRDVFTWIHVVPSSNEAHGGTLINARATKLSMSSAILKQS